LKTGYIWNTNKNKYITLQYVHLCDDDDDDDDDDNNDILYLPNVQSWRQSALLTCLFKNIEYF